jgi:hypothetical protein
LAEGKKTSEEFIDEKVFLRTGRNGDLLLRKRGFPSDRNPFGRRTKGAPASERADRDGDDIVFF